MALNAHEKAEQHKWMPDFRQSEKQKEASGSAGLA